MTHLNHDAFTDVFYGLASSEQAAHLRQCASCRERLRAWERRREESSPLPQFTSAELTAQRNAVRARFEDVPPRRSWVPAFVAAGVMAVAIVAYLPSTGSITKSVAVASVEPAQEDDLAELLAVELSGEPLAASPLRGLFESAE